MEPIQRLLETYAPPMTMSEAQDQVDYLFGSGNTFYPAHVAVVAYLLMVFLLPRVLSPLYEKFTPLYEVFTTTVLKPVMVVWNLLLSVLSFAMLVGVALPWANTVWKHYQFGLSDVVCDTDRMMFGNGPSVATTITWYFMLSKFLELFDTLFLIVKKPSRKVPFLHWYHHTTVLLFCWYAGFYQCSTGPFFICMNATIHTFMYYYYAMTELGYKPTWNILLTVGQIVQMFLGIVISIIFAVRNKATDGGCACQNADNILIACALMYGSYLLLFVQFFVQKYLVGGGKPKQKKA